MTRGRWAMMAPEDQRTKVAELSGWTDIRPADQALCDVADIGATLEGRLGHGAGLCGHSAVPDFLDDLNAMHVLEMGLGRNWLIYSKALRQVVLAGEPDGATEEWRRHLVQCACAAQRAEAFALTMEKE